MKSLIPEKTTELEKSLPNSTRILKELVLKRSQHQWSSHCSKIEGKKEENERKEKKKAKGHNEPWSYEPRLPWIKNQIKIQEKEKSLDEYRKNLSLIQTESKTTVRSSYTVTSWFHSGFEDGSTYIDQQYNITHNHLKGLRKRPLTKCIIPHGKNPREAWNVRNIPQHSKGFLQQGPQ